MNSYQGTNSFVTPNPTSVTTPVSGIQTYTNTSLGGAVPLLSDLLTAKPTANSFQQQTYTGDSQVISDRLKQYSVYNTSSLGDLANYLAPKAALNANGNLFFKPEDFKSATSNFTTLDTLGLTNTPLSEDTKSLGKMGGKDIYDLTSLQDELSARDTPIFDSLLQQYGLSPSDLAKYGTTYSTPNVKVNSYGDPVYETYTNNYGEQSTKYDANGNPVLDMSGTPSYTKAGLLQSTLGGQHLNWQDVVSLLPQSNEIIPHNPAYSQLLGQYDSLYTSKPVQQVFENTAKSLGLTNDEMTKLAGITAGNLYNKSFQSGTAPYSMGYYDAVPQYMDTLSNFYKQAYGKDLPTNVTDYLTNAGKDIDSQFTSARQIQSHSGGFFSDILPMVSTVLKFTPLAPVAYAYDAYNAIKSGSPLAMAGAALGAYGAYTGTDIAGSVGGAINDFTGLGLSPEMIKALGNTTLGTGMGVLGGQDFGTALAGGLGSGAGGYLGGNLAGSLDLSPAMTKALAGIGSGIGGAALTGNDVGMGALSGGLNAMSSYGGNTLNPINGVSTIAQQLLKNKRRQLGK
jgi:hypothetical protein